MTRHPKALFAFADSLDPARRLAAALGLPCVEIELHRFPDGESRVRVPEAAEAALLYRSLDRPNDKLVDLLLAASSLRDSGTARLTLVAPYLCYMRQDMAFRPGEAVSQRAVCGFLDRLFDAVVTVEPHLHRIDSLAAVFPTAQAAALSATGLLAEALRTDGVDPATVLVGPDG
ncbi:MAG: ribose-phosphate pyrophosphokinase-like domain-containing protein, partial [Alphaproteobacteria bacterium]